MNTDSRVILSAAISSKSPFNPEPGPMKTGNPPREYAPHLYTSLLWLLTLLFAIRVAGQAIQHWLPLSLLPPFNAFQGSGLPYWLLLSTQLAILVVMIRASHGVQTGILIPSHRTGLALAWFGWIYMTGSLIRIAIGLAMPDAPAWFSTWIPAFFHVVLAGFVLILSSYHRYQTPFAPREITQ